MMTRKQRNALLVGATGLIGRSCLDHLLEDETVGVVTVLSRVPLARSHPKLQQHIVDFENLGNSVHLIRGDDVFCCVGTTMRDAGSKEKFEAVDFSIPYEIAKIARLNGASQFLVVSSVGADARSTIFYPSVKGRMEDAVKSVPFRAVHIFRPSQLLGKRTRRRLGEMLASPALRLFSPLMLGQWRKYRPIAAREVAQSMVVAAHSTADGVFVYERDQMRDLLKKNHELTT